MKSTTKLNKKQLQEKGFIIVDGAGGSKLIIKHGQTIDDIVFYSRAMTEKTLIKRANEFLNNN